MDGWIWRWMEEVVCRTIVARLSHNNSSKKIDKKNHNFQGTYDV
jgi:hypothetical protein